MLGFVFIHRLLRFNPLALPSSIALKHICLALDLLARTAAVCTVRIAWQSTAVLAQGSLPLLACRAAAAARRFLATSSPRTSLSAAR